MTIPDKPVPGEQNSRGQFHKTVLGDMTIEGYSRAPIMSFWRVPELKLGFDLGWQPWEFMGTPRWFISHTHMDHILALPAYAARRQMMEMTPPVIYLPAGKVNEVQMLLNAFTRLDNGRLPCELIGVHPGDEIELSRELVVTVSKTYHTVTSVGYIVWERRQKLKPEYIGFSGEQIRSLKESGTKITYEVRFPRIAYLGDSTIQGLDETPDMYKADVLITEMTFVTSDELPDMVKTSGHIHLNDIVSRRERFENKLVIAGHFSARYTKRDVLTRVHDLLPDMLGGRLKLWL